MSRDEESRVSMSVRFEFRCFYSAENGRGDACEYDNDGDGVTDMQDACPNNANIQRTDLSHFQLIKLDPEGSAQIDPHWIVRNRGQELVQTINSDPGLAIGKLTVSELSVVH